MKKQIDHVLAALMAALALAVVLPSGPASALSVSRPAVASVPAVGRRQAAAAAGWLAPGWRYRRPITVTNDAYASLTNYQVAVSLTAANFDFSHSTGKDLRFTAADGVTGLAHWVESYSTTALKASIFVRLPQLAARTSQIIYLYYGNPTAFDAASGRRTFALYDGFDRMRNAAAPLVTPTYDGSGQVVHPDVVRFAAKWSGYTYWMADTPYPNSNDKYENPSILASNDGTNWSVPTGLQNPLVPTPPCDHNNDPELLYHQATDELWLYYLETRRAARCSAFMNEPYYNHNYLKLMKSSDGVHWSPPVTVIDWSLAENPLYVSPAIVEVSSGFVLWAVDAGRFTLRSARSSDGVTFGSLQPVGLGDQIWHVNVEYVPTKHEYWMLYDYPSSPLGVVRFAKSVDGLTWTTYTNRALTYTNGWDASLYRSAFLYDPGTNLLRVWYSAHSSSAVWHVGQTSFDYDKFLAQLLTPPWTVRQGSGSWAVSAARVRRGNLSGRLVQLSTSSIWARKAAPLGNNFYLESDVYDDLDSTAFTMVRAVNPLDKRLGVGVWTGSSGSKYVFHDQNYRYVATTKARTVGWHKFGILIRSDASVTYYIDGQNVGSLTGQFNDASRIHVEGYYRAPTTYYVDDIRVRTWNAVAPRALVGAEQAQPV